MFSTGAGPGPGTGTASSTKAKFPAVGSPWGRPTRHVGHVTTPEMARSLAVRVLIRELRATRAAVTGQEPSQETPLTPLPSL